MLLEQDVPVNSFVFTKRNWSAVTNEVVQSRNEFRNMRLANDQQDIISTLKTFVNVTTATDARGRGNSFADDVIVLHVQRSFLYLQL